MSYRYSIAMTVGIFFVGCATTQAVPTKPLSVTLDPDGDSVACVTEAKGSRFGRKRQLRYAACMIDKGYEAAVVVGGRSHTEPRGVVWVSHPDGSPGTTWSDMAECQEQAKASASFGEMALTGLLHGPVSLGPWARTYGQCMATRGFRLRTWEGSNRP